MDYIINFLNNKQMSAGETIIISVASTIIALVIINLFKNVLFKAVINSYNKCKKILKRKYRKFKGQLTIGDLIELEKKQKAGLHLSKKEEEMLAEHQKKIAASVSKLADSLKNIRLPNIDDFNR